MQKQGKAGGEGGGKDGGKPAKLLCTVGDTCEVCRARSTIHLCSMCRTARYCGEDCQASRWEDHKDYCQVLVRRRELGVALYFASRDGKEQEVPLLVSLGAEVGYKLEEQPNLGWSPLLAASSKGHEKVVRALLKAGAKPNQSGAVGERTSPARRVPENSGLITLSTLRRACVSGSASSTSAMAESLTLALWFACVSTITAECFEFVPTLSASSDTVPLKLLD